LDEAAGAADATACSRDGYFLSYKICVLSDNRLRCAVPTFLDDLYETQHRKQQVIHLKRKAAQLGCKSSNLLQRLKTTNGSF